MRFIDIETAPEYEEFEQMPAAGQSAFKRKLKRSEQKIEEQEIPDIYKKRAALYPEFSRIISLSTGYIAKDEAVNSEFIAVKVFTGDERSILVSFLNEIDRGDPAWCAHNGNAFDFPFLFRRLLKHGYNWPGDRHVGAPYLIDTLNIWQFNQPRDYISLETLAYFFGIPTPKDDLKGEDVPAAFFRGEIDRIANYNMKDVITLARVYRKLICEPDVTMFKYTASQLPPGSQGTPEPQ